MIYFFVVLLGLISLVGIKFAKPDKFFDDYLDQEYTNAIKGIFVIMIFISHYRYFFFRDTSGNIPLDLFGQKMVSMFFFYSGVGILESVKKKGKKYSNRLIIKFFAFHFKYAFMMTINYVIKKVINPNDKLNYKFLLRQYFILDFGFQFNWFICTYILILFYSFISFLPFNNNNTLLPVILVTLFIYFHYRLMIYLKKPSFYIDNIFNFPMGLLFSLYKGIFEKLIKKNDKTYYFILIVISILMYKIKFLEFKYLPTIITKNVIFSNLVILITLKVQFNNGLLQSMNKHSLGILMTQGMFFIIFKKYKSLKGNEYVEFIIIFLLTVFSAILFDESTDFIVSYFYKINVDKILNKLTCFRNYHTIQENNKNNQFRLNSIILDDNLTLSVIK